jgi:hypothetical protein
MFHHTHPELNIENDPDRIASRVQHVRVEAQPRRGRRTVATPKAPTIINHQGLSLSWQTQ